MEVWKTAIYNGEVYDNYEVSNLGQVRSVNYNHTGKAKILKPRMVKGGYLVVGLHKNGKQKQCYTHRLVAYTFIENDEPTVKTEVNHINEDKTLNTVENLEWCTRKHNINHGTRNRRDGKTKSKKIIGKSLTENKVIVFQSIKQAGKFGFAIGHICNCCQGKQRQHKGYVWSYID